MLIPDGEYAIAELDGYVWTLTTDTAPEDKFSGASMVARRSCAFDDFMLSTKSEDGRK